MSKVYKKRPTKEELINRLLMTQIRTVIKESKMLCIECIERGLTLEEMQEMIGCVLDIIIIDIRKTSELIDEISAHFNPAY